MNVSRILRSSIILSVADRKWEVEEFHNPGSAREIKVPVSGTVKKGLLILQKNSGRCH